MKQVEIIPNAMIPVGEQLDENGLSWLQFKYNFETDEPWKWPKAIKYDGKIYQWSCYNSDSMNVHYKEISINKLAFPTKIN